MAGGLLTITSFAASAASAITGVAAIVTGNEGMEKASMYTGYIAMGAGLGVYAMGRIGAAAVKTSVPQSPLRMETIEAPVFSNLKSSKNLVRTSISPNPANGNITKNVAVESAPKVPAVPSLKVSNSLSRNATPKVTQVKTKPSEPVLNNKTVDMNLPESWQYQDEDITMFVSDTPPRFAGDRGDVSFRTNRVRILNQLILAQRF
ncbi:hypothetical protein BK662_32035 [Pseudomonas frederiksbergensis]|uniref:Uncharacterized protein n=2 Tax=Pseudomonas frederiksbergensis TaxID=104087 RepID=A0A423HEI7_9PSED|nr:hypothetical protein BK662_32035 [Pseudomonas frederiksbergensis]